MRVPDDPDTSKLLEIVEHFLVEYFAHHPAEARHLVDAFVSGAVYDADFVHHEGAYRTAGIVHFLCALHGERSRLGDWLQQEQFRKTPEEALEYFRKHYFE